ncbi:hypothetical protein PUR71_36090 [Streptomyces sp. SP17BM10]|uniref:hypothetical protein n=1 Tax=Streptomyces sp. SP17BM10 TaxID=3002530 RepID=UPI002E79E07A|nr:hypothetical protein [Streptomyces sp. SP17BM10]MEE1788279.1 hypothetical protein [Streptomyces sp. SP17BM10]
MSGLYRLVMPSIAMPGVLAPPDRAPDRDARVAAEVTDGASGAQYRTDVVIILGAD